MITLDLAKISDNQGSCSGESSNVCASHAVCSTESDKSVTNCTVSPGGMRYFMPSIVAGSDVPFRNQAFDSLDKAYKFYKEYGRLGGFDVRKTTKKRDADGTIILKHFVCSKEGFNDGSHCEENRQRRTVSRRSGCKAKVVMKIMSQNRYYVFNFVELHNHPLASESGRQFLRASREMTVSLRNIVFDAAKINIGCSKTFSLVKEMTGGYSNVGATLRDFRNFDRDLKEFETSKSFYFAYELDGDGHLTMLFWADPTSRRNFEIYGDAVSFDATFDTNKYNMIFAPFTGVDKHDRCVTFAACLLSKEDVAHYNWAFKQFVKAMGRNLVIFITDQCPAMKLGNRLCKETDFMEKMKTYIWSSNLEIDEFESGWKAFHKQGDTLCEFWIRFESAMHRERNKTERLDHESNSSKPNMLSRWFIEDDATDLFTRSIFYKVQEEILASCLDMQIKKMSEEVDGVTQFEIKDVKVKDKLFKVSVSRSHALCSCKQFVMCGIVCRHAFCGLKQIGVTKFPRSLVLNRWMKVAECGTSLESNVVYSDYFKMEQVSLKLTNLWFDFRQILNKAGIEMDKLDYVHKIIKQIGSDFEKYDGDAVDFTKKDHMAAW
nr:PREDICTED: protein FAR1-RELATED SEQUENCE 5-like [Daucus carota subsp. sativus]